MRSFAAIANGREFREAGSSVARHRHVEAYVAVVLSGGYEECGSKGRFRVSAGDVLLHDMFDTHLDHFQGRGAQILNLVGNRTHFDFSFGRVDDPDEIVRAAERDPAQATELLRCRIREARTGLSDWPDLLAMDLLRNPQHRLDVWAMRHNLAAETVSRGFRKVFGVTPVAFRGEARAHRALRIIADGGTAFAAVAAATGFADQAHMSRAVRRLTGTSPRAWRRSNPFKTDAMDAA